MGPRDGLEWCGKSRLPLGFDLQTFQHVTSRYTDYTTWPLSYKSTEKYILSCDFNTLRTGDADLRFYITTVQDG